MKGYIAFTKKEWMESVRSYKVFLMGFIFAILGMMNPLTAKITPELLKNFMPKGVTVVIESVSAIDSWQQFYKNVPQIGLIILVIMFGGMMSKEWNQQTLIPLLTKGLSRRAVILAKFTVVTLIFTCSYILCTVISWGYTVYFWPSTKVYYELFAVVCLWLAGVMLIGIMLLASVVFKSYSGVLLFTGGYVVILNMISIIPNSSKYSPLALFNNNMNLIKGNEKPADFIWPIVLCLIIFCTSIIGSIFIFNKKEV